MLNRKALSLALVASAVLSLTGVSLAAGTPPAGPPGNPPANPPSPADVAARAIARLGEIATNAPAAIATSAQETVTRIQTLKSNNAPLEQIRLAGRRGQMRLNGIAEEAHERTRRTAFSAVGLLTRLNASPELIDSVKTAGQTTGAAIRAAAEAGRQAIRDALSAAGAGPSSSTAPAGKPTPAGGSGANPAPAGSST
ncbi:MAG: hypothetical protein IBJ11_03080 [Phycisphaerales bacterium]|nr:hypothetical protein [Phycisphaerales bacterium]